MLPAQGNGIRTEEKRPGKACREMGFSLRSSSVFIGSEFLQAEGEHF